MRVFQTRDRSSILRTRTILYMKLFLSVPFSSRVDDTGAVPQDYKDALGKVLEHFRSNSDEIWCALEDVGWNIHGSVDPADEFRKDFAQIDEADELLVLLEERVSTGVQIEIGYALAKNKRIRMFQIGQPSWSNTAVSSLGGYEIELVHDVDEFASRVVSGT